MITIEGVYENGQTVLNKQPKNLTKTKVIVVFEKENAKKVLPSKKRPFGLGKGKSR